MRKKRPWQSPRRLILIYLPFKLNYKPGPRLLQCFFLDFLIPSSWRVSYIIQISLDHPDPTFVDRLSLYLSVRPIKHPLWLFMSCSSQGSTVQEYSPHKCGQKSSFGAFNAVVVAFPYIFLDSLPSRMFMRHVPITGASIKVLEHIFELSLSYSRRNSSSNLLSFISYL